MIKLYFILMGTVVFLSCKDEEAPYNWTHNMEEEINFEVAENVTILYTDSSLLKAKIKGKILRRYIDRVKPFDEFSNGVVVDFFDKNGFPESRMTADYTIRYDKDEIIVARDPNGVILSNNNGDTLISTEIIWDNKEDKIYTQRFVKVVTSDRIIWGQGFESNNDFSKGHIQAVEGELIVDNIIEDE